MRSTLAAVLAFWLVLGCAGMGGDDEVVAAPRAADSPSDGRLLVKTASLTVVVADVAAAADSAAAVVRGLGGHVTGSELTEAKRARLDLRVPAARLDEALAALAALGEERSRSVSASEVTGEVSDLEAALANQRALRDRLRALLARAQKVEEVLAVERELTRLQTELDRGEARLARLRNDVALSAVTVHLEQKPRPKIYGPLGYLWLGTEWFVTKLFVIRE